MNDNEPQHSLLIVDDMTSNIQVLANALQDDYRIKVATSGQKAIEIANSDNPPDLVLLDIMMPEIDGYEVCRELKSNPKISGIPVIFVTSLNEVDEEERGLNLGAVDYITKPFHLPIVKARVRNHLSLKLKTDLLEELSHIDGLTHIANRRHFDAFMSKQLRRTQRSAQPTTVIMIDVDFFKPYNDNYGHGLGDDCLVQVARGMRLVIKRPNDLLARYGGEEFAVILPETPLDGGLQVANELHQAISELNLKHEFSDVADHVTISIGVATSVVTDDAQVQALLKRADAALYQAKHNGRNQVVIG
ncbi:MAG: diguanylate cyclase [Thiomicrospira sp.]|uniref:diguanylate cyclase n=1 Tax=Thiomicrospira sp. TaxID=935 RepID=UPI0019DCEFF6|nr:diguanylate cyclase [Thiomicrospira sp.]MBE0494559.1 diguanylate cyclase [Thiomicrospira sp.]